MTLLYEQTLTQGNEAYSDVYESGMLIQAGSSLIGTTITKAEVYLSYFGSAGPLSGNISCYIQDSGGTTQETLGTIAANTVTQSIGLFTFENTGASHVIAAGERIVIGWGASTGPNSTYLRVWASTSSVVDDVKFQFYYNTALPPATWQDRLGDWAAKLYGGGSGPSGGGTRLPPPPLVVHF